MGIEKNASKTSLRAASQLGSSDVDCVPDKGWQAIVENQSDARVSGNDGESSIKDQKYIVNSAEGTKMNVRFFVNAPD